MPVKGLGDGEKLLRGRKNKTNVKTLANLCVPVRNYQFVGKPFVMEKKEMGVKENK